MKQYRLQPGTSSKIFYLLTVKDNGTMLLYFKGTDRSITEEVTENADGWLVTKNGSQLPPLSNQKWMALPYPASITATPDAEAAATETPDNPENPKHRNIETSKHRSIEISDAPRPLTAKQYYSQELNFAEEEEESHMTRNIVAGVLTIAVAVVLINTVGVFGLAGLGILAGGCLK